jgi:hypothetical protein
MPKFTLKPLSQPLCSSLLPALLAEGPVDFHFPTEIAGFGRLSDMQLSDLAYAQARIIRVHKRMDVRHYVECKPA